MIGLAVELEPERQVQTSDEAVTEERRLGGCVDPAERDRPAAVAEIVDLADEREVEGDVVADEVHVVGEPWLRAAAR